MKRFWFVLLICIVLSVVSAAPVKANHDPYPPPATELAEGSWRVECTPSHVLNDDPIVFPGQPGLSHEHEFWGSTTTNAFSDYASMLASPTTCQTVQDHAGYWNPSLKAPSGETHRGIRSITYYRNRPSNYGTTRAFPPDFRVIAGNPYPGNLEENKARWNVYWTCSGESDTGLLDRKNFIPDCRGTERNEARLHVWFPSCWDGHNLDSVDHRSHMAYGLNNGVENPSNPKTCPATHPVKVPQLNFRVIFTAVDPAGYLLSDGNVLPHADFWNTWTQSGGTNTLENLVTECMNVTPSSCGWPKP